MATQATALSPARVSEKTEVDAIYHKINWRIVPIILFAYILAFLDRINVGFTQLQMKQDLDFSDGVFGLGAGLFFITYLMFEVPSNLLLEKIGARYTFLRIMVLWGLTSASMMFVSEAWHFYTLRLLLGIFEAGFFPGVILYLTYWYPSSRRARVTGLFLFGMPITGVIGGPITSMIMSGMNGYLGFKGWQWVFLIEGVPSVLMGFVTWAYLTDKPEQATWLTADEKRIVHAELQRDKAALGDRQHGILASLKDPKIWLLVLVYFCIIAANSSLTFFAPTLVKGLGFTDPLSIGWIMAAIYLCGAAGMILNGRHSDHAKEERLHCGVAALLGSVGIAAVAFIGNVPVLALPALALAIVGTMSAIPVFWQLPNLFLSGSAAACGIALINSIANLAGFGAPWFLGTVKTQTGVFTSGLLTVAVIEALTIVLILIFIPRKRVE